MEKGLTSRQQQAINTKLSLIDSVHKLMNEKNYEEITIKEITEEANVSVGAFYHHFSSKEDLIMYDYIRFDNIIMNEFSQKKFNSSIEAIRELIYFQTHGSDAYGPKVMNQTLRVQLITQGKHVLENERYFHTYLKKLVENAINNNELSSACSVEEVTNTILRISRGALFDWSMRSEKKFAYENAIHDLDIILNHYKTL